MELKQYEKNFAIRTNMGNVSECTGFQKSTCYTRNTYMHDSPSSLNVETVAE